MIQHGFPRTRNLTAPEVREYWEVRYRLSTDNGLMLLDGRIVISRIQRRKVLHCLYSVHQGAVDMKARANESVYWPSMNASIRSIWANYKVCLNITPSQPREPNILTQSPDWPFQQIVMDLFFVADHAYFACADRLTGWLILYHQEPGHATTSKLISIYRQHISSICSKHMVPHTNSETTAALISPPAYSKNSLRRDELSTDYPQSYIPNLMAEQSSRWKP